MAVDREWRSQALGLTRSEARQSLDRSIQVTDRKLVASVVVVVDSCDYAARALNIHGIEPTAEAVAMLACKIADVHIELQRLEMERERVEIERARLERE